MDITKSTLLFSKGIILVEGICEAMLLPVFAPLVLKEYNDKNQKKSPNTLEEAGVTVVNINGINFKYFYVIIDYPLPKAAVREAVYNAIIHSNYAALVPIQIRIHEDAVYISNDCVFPVGWTVETLMERHRSQPYNPNIANGFFRAGYVETWGRGIEKICEACKKHGVPMPEYTLHLEDIMVKFTPHISVKVPKGQNGTLDGTLNGTLKEKVISMINKNPYITQMQIALTLDCSERKIKRLMKTMREDGMIERVGGRRSGQWVVK